MLEKDVLKYHKVGVFLEGMGKRGEVEIDFGKASWDVSSSAQVRAGRGV